MTLYQELTTGPLAAEIAQHIASGNDGAIYAILHRKDIPALGLIQKNKFAVWAAKTGQRAVIEDTAVSAGDSCRSIAIALQDLLRGNLDAGLDLSVQDTVDMMGLWLVSGKMTQAVSDSLHALGANSISRADQLPDLTITIETIAQALRG